MRAIPYERLVALAEGNLTQDERAWLLAQVAADPQATADLAWLEHAIEFKRTANELQRAVGLPFSAQQRLRAPTRIVAQPRSGSQQSRYFGRVVGFAPTQYQVFQANDYEIDLRITRCEAGYIVQGTFHGSQEQGMISLSNAHQRYVAPLNRQMHFQLPPVNLGNYELTIRLESVEVIINLLIDA